MGQVEVMPEEEVVEADLHPDLDMEMDQVEENLHLDLEVQEEMAHPAEAHPHREEVTCQMKDMGGHKGTQDNEG